ncbi:MAG: D-alanyl-D-alanine carboxypeptidase [Ruminiclostridium sp.]|nr:D-alanyl-D-alanine carboxypeptidase [Ruminiclostridium sp.]
MKKIISVITAFLTTIGFCFTCHAAPEDISAYSAVVINADTGEILFEKNAHEQRAIASTTKIMTTLLTIEAGQPDKLFTVDSMAIRVEGTSMGLQEGDIVSRRALCYGMLLPSGNDAANAAAVSVSGSMNAFADIMNRKAAEIGMTNTHFVNPSGLDAEGHYSTAYDMAVLTRYAMKNDEFSRICASSSASLEYGNPPYRRTLYNSNKLLAQYDGCIGVKTGFTDEARRCLVSAAERDGKTVIAVTLNAPDDWSDHAQLLDYGFSQLTSYEISPESFTIPVFGSETHEIRISPEQNASVGLGEKEQQYVSIEYHIPRFAYAGIYKGEQLGTAKIYYKNTEVASIPMLAESACIRKTPEKDVFGQIMEIFGIS